MKRLAVMLTLGLAVVSTLPAAAETVCGKQTHSKFDETRIYADDFIATCRPDGTCAAVTYTKDPQAPLGWWHRLSIERPTREGDWIVQLTAVERVPDLSDGMTLTVDENEDMAIAYEFLSAGKVVNDVLVDGRLTQPVLDEFLPGTRVAWNFAAKHGHGGTAIFSLVGLKAAMAWIDCAQGRK